MQTDVDASAAPTDTAGRRFAPDERLPAQFLTLVRAVHGTPGHRILYWLAAAIVLVIVSTAGMQVLLNAWNKPFYDAIQAKDFGGFVHQLGIFFAIAGVLLVLNVAQTGLNQTIRMKLREFATRDLIDTWMSEKRAARISRAGEIGVNPDQRIHEDARHLTDVATDLGIGLLQSVLLLLSFIGVLWSLSSGIVLTYAGRDFSIPGYMVWAALAYAATGSLLSWRVGRPLVRLAAERYQQESDLRVALVRGAEQADGIALAGGEADERRRLGMELQDVLGVTWRTVKATIGLTWVTAGYGWVALVVPIIVAAPGYFGGKLTFGELMMVVGAFNQVQQALRWFVDNTGQIADWRATMLRVMGFREALTELDRLEDGVPEIEHGQDPDGMLVLDRLVVGGGRDAIKLSEPRLAIRPGERVLVHGPPACGKSRLFLAVAGLWNWGTGRIGLPPAGETMFLSQRPFVPAGKLRDVLTYSRVSRPVPDEELRAVLERSGLPHLVGSLDRVDRWDVELSHEEQHRVTYARLLIKRPKWVVSDEALDLLENGTREIILSIFGTELADTAVLSIASSPPVNGFYQRVARIVPASETRDKTARRRP